MKSKRIIACIISVAVMLCCAVSASAAEIEGTRFASPFFFNYGAYISGTSFSTYFSATLRPNVPVNYSFDDTIVLDGVVATGYDIYGHAVVGSVTDPIVTHGLSHSTTFYFTFDVETGIGTYYFDGGSFFVSDAII